MFTMLNHFIDLIDPVLMMFMVASWIMLIGTYRHSFKLSTLLAQNVSMKILCSQSLGLTFMSLSAALSERTLILRWVFGFDQVLSSRQSIASCIFNFFI